MAVRLTRGMYRRKFSAFDEVFRYLPVEIVCCKTCGNALKNQAHAANYPVATIGSAWVKQGYIKDVPSRNAQGNIIYPYSVCIFDPLGKQVGKVGNFSSLIRAQKRIAKIKPTVSDNFWIRVYSRKTGTMLLEVNGLRKPKRPRR